jgi:hypothetical protein
VKLRIVIPILLLSITSCGIAVGFLDRDINEIMTILDDGIDSDKLRAVNEKLSLLRERIVEDKQYYIRVSNELHHLNRALGRYRGMDLFLTYFCADVCPEGGGFVIYFNGIESAEDCEEVGGEAYYSYAWGTQYRFCTPLASE